MAYIDLDIAPRPVATDILAVNRRRDRHIETGISLMDEDRCDEALGEFQAASRLDPWDHRPLVNMAAAYRGLGRAEDAVKAAWDAVRLDTDCPEAYDNLGVMLKDIGDFETAEKCHREALAIRPAHFEFLNNLAVVLEKSGRLREAVPIWEQMAAQRPDSPMARLGLGIVRLASEDYARGWAGYDARLEIPPCSTRIPPGVPRWDGRPIDGTLLLCSTDGFGDAVMGVRHAVDAKRLADKVVVRCSKPLANLLARAPGVDRVVLDSEPYPEAAAWASIHSLHRHFGVGEPDCSMVPYLSADLGRTGHYFKRFADIGPYDSTFPLVVGVAWQGDPNHCDDHRRSFRLSELDPLHGIPGVELVSLQRGFGVEQIEGWRFPILELGDGYNSGDYIETAAAIQACDLIVCCDTGIGHLAGAMGKPCWLALAKAGEWRWPMGREDSAWYPNHRIFRQPEHGDWKSVFDRMADELRAILS